MRARWHDWVITLALIALTTGGVWALWGKDIVALFRGAPDHETNTNTPAAAPVETDRVSPAPTQTL